MISKPTNLVKTTKTSQNIYLFRNQNKFEIPDYYFCLRAIYIKWSFQEF